MEIGYLSLAEAMSTAERNPPTEEFDDCINLSSYTQADATRYHLQTLLGLAESRLRYYQTP